MTLPISVIGFFCEDIREEKSGGTTILGVMPDSANLPPLPPGTAAGTLQLVPKLCIYLRASFDPQSPPTGVTCTLLLQDGTRQALAIFEDALIARGAREAIEIGSPIAGVIGRVEMVPFKALPGRVRVEVTVGDVTYIAAAINFIFPASTSSPTASPPPS